MAEQKTNQAPAEAEAYEPPAVATAQSVEEYAEATKHTDVVAVPSLNADGTVDQTPGYTTLAKSDEIPDRITPAGYVKGADVANHPDEKAGSKAAEAKKGTKG